VILIAVAAAVVVVVAAVVTWLLVRDEKTDRPAASAPSTSPAASKGTQVITAVAVDASGHPANGYREAPVTQAPGNVIKVSGCSASPAAVAADIYSCAPTAAGADVCWPAPPGSLLCLNDPWKQELHRVTTGPLPQVQPTPAPAPFALQLEDGTQCRLRNGGAWGGRDDGLVGAYGCGTGNPVVLVEQSAHSSLSAIDQSKPLWTVKVGSLGAGDAHLPPPQTRIVTTAWFAGNAGGA